eukprot:TRINITY_DN12985_c2_g1_i2.p1 TRINITY_DN12985_c2_g1~~TRINITY_DN12985_c2_g1_i2.p1  ORF type:complete len:222 (+),score=45.43 TRINITY_DN12985_c2_g1_i2:90-755(+)
MDNEEQLPQRTNIPRRGRGTVTEQVQEQEQEQVKGQGKVVDMEICGQEEEEQEYVKEAQGEPLEYAPLQLTEYRTQAVDDFQFEYLDHTADVQLHAWGKNLQEAFEQVGLAMFNYMTPLSGMDINQQETRQYEVEGHDLDSLLFAFLDELLFIFCTEFFVCKQIQIQSFDVENFKIAATGFGDIFDRQRHVCGTEVKAITYSAMQIIEKQDDAEVFVIIDI